MAILASSKAVAAATTHVAQFSIQYSSIALVWYDYILTSSLEAEYMWRGKLRWSTIAYIFLRYPLPANVLYLFAISHRLPNCDVWYKFIGALSILGRASVIATFTVRTVAVYDTNKFVAAWLGFIGVTCVALDITHVPGLKCAGTVAIPIVPTLLSILVCVFELSATGLIAARAIRAFRQKGTFRKDGLLSWIFKQGLLYFFGVFAFQLTAVVLNFVTTNADFQRLINALTLPMSCLLTARFLLNLRQFNAEQTLQKTATLLSTLHFGGSVRAAVVDEFEDPDLTSLGSRTPEQETVARKEQDEDVELTTTSLVEV